MGHRFCYFFYIIVLFLKRVLPGRAQDRLLSAERDYRILAGRHSRRNESGYECQENADEHKRSSSHSRQDCLQGLDACQVQQYRVDRYQQEQAHADPDNSGAGANDDGLGIEYARDILLV